MEGYITQYVDMLNLRFLDMDRDGRQKSISIMAKRFAEKNKEYLVLEQEVTVAARRHQCSVEDIKMVGQDYPEDFEW
jgi:hypothetical protein